MPAFRIWRDTVSESGTWYHRALMLNRFDQVQVVNDYGATALVQVFDLQASNVSTAIYSNTRSISAILTNTLQDWDVNTVGYNLEITNLSNAFDRQGGHTYRICAYLPHDLEGTHAVVWEVTPEALFGV